MGRVNIDTPPSRSTPRHNFNDLEAVAGGKLPAGEFRRGNGLSIVFDDHAAGQQLLCNQEFFNRAGQFRLDLLAVRDNGASAHFNRPPSANALQECFLKLWEPT